MKKRKRRKMKCVTLGRFFSGPRCRRPKVPAWVWLKALALLGQEPRHAYWGLAAYELGMALADLLDSPGGKRLPYKTQLRAAIRTLTGSSTGVGVRGF